MAMNNVSPALKGIQDSRSWRGIFARGKNVYKGASHASKSKNRAIQNAAQRRVRGR